MILRWFAPEIALGPRRGVGEFGDSFGAYLLMWAVFTAFLTFGAYYVNLPAFLAFAAAGGRLPAGRDREHRRARRAPRCCDIAGWIGIADGICAWWVGFGAGAQRDGPAAR